MKSSKTQLKITVMFRYALECGKKCQTNMKDSILEKTFHQLKLSVDSCKCFVQVRLIVDHMLMVLGCVVRTLLTDNVNQTRSPSKSLN